MNTRLHSSGLAHIALVLTLTFAMASFTAFAAKRPGGGGGGGGTTTPKPPTPTNFRVTGKTAYTISVAWDAASSSTDFNFHLSGTRATPGRPAFNSEKSHVHRTRSRQ